MKVHGNAMGKTAYKQTRTLELEFTLAPRNRNQFHGESSRGAGAISRSSRRHHDTQMEIENLNVEDTCNQNLPPPKIDAQNEQDFPSLSGTTSTFQANLSGLRDISTYVGQSKLKNTTENFPA
jgi:E3 ubiquitin-protein ligase ZNF598